MKECPHTFAHERLSKSGWAVCFACGKELNPEPEFRAFTADLLDREP